MEWLLLEDQYGYKCEIQESDYADMLNDRDRNIKYYNALKKIIHEMKANNERVHVLDIGCGSGILSMMALKLGADKVTACESFEPMYKCAERVIQRNGLLTDKIHLIHSSSMKLRIGENMSERANVLVSEIFDSELIGEGVLPVFEHAVCNLLTTDAHVIPYSARIFVQAVKSPLLRDHNHLKENKYLTKFPLSFYKCMGYSSGYDLQTSSLANTDSFQILSPPILVKNIHFKTVSSNDVTTIYLPNVSGDVDAFVLWWQLTMSDVGNDSILTAPQWACECPSDYKWRDHWLQVAFFSKKCGDKLPRLTHDNYSFWMDDGYFLEQPRCTCGLHLHLARSRICQLNSSEYSKQIDYITKYAETKNSKVVVVISDFSYVPMAMADRGISVYNIIDNDKVRQLSQSFFDINQRSSANVTLSSLDNLDNITFDAVIGDPFFVCSLMPWDDLHFWCILDKLRHHLSNHGFISPQKMAIKLVLVHFEHLHKINSSIGSIEGFDMSAFDDVMKNDYDMQLSFESKFLWEYGCCALSEVGTLITLDMTMSFTGLLEQGITDLCDSYTFQSPPLPGVNGLVLWVTWELAGGTWIDNSLGGIHPDTKTITWKPVTKQAVHFFKSDFPLSLTSQVKIDCHFNLSKADFHFTMES